MNLIGPLTTTFTPPASSHCFSEYVFVTSGVLPFFQQGTVSSALYDCFPSSFNDNAGYYYSPGICPAGYNYACSYEISNAGAPATTVATCCPTGYTCWDLPSTSDWNPCRSDFASSTDLEVSAFYFDLQGEGGWYTPTSRDTTTLLATLSQPIYARGPIVVRADGDPEWSVTASPCSAPSASGASETSGAEAAATQSGGTVDGSQGGSSSGGNDGGLSTGAIIGICLGTIFGVLFFGGGIAAAYIMGRRRSERKQQQQQQQPGPEMERADSYLTFAHSDKGPASSGITAYDGRPMTTPENVMSMQSPHELYVGGNPNPELDSRAMIGELNAAGEPAELRGSW